MGYERYIQNTDPRGDYDVHDDLAQPRDRWPRESNWDRGDRHSSAGRYELEANAPRSRPVSGDARYGDARYPGRSDGDRYYGGSYASDGRRFAETDRSHTDRETARDSRWNSYGERPDRADRDSANRQSQPRDERQGGYDYDDRGFIARAGDEVRSWFGDDEAERRRMLDERYDNRLNARDARAGDGDYDSWRRRQIDALDRDYHEYRQENQAKFHSEFSNWRDERQGQRSSLSKVQEHMEVVGADGAHVGTVDKVRGDRIILTKNDENAGGHHHSIPSRWIQSVEDKVTIRKSAQEAMAHWRDEERNQALFDNDRDPAGTDSSQRRRVTGSY